MPSKNGMRVKILMAQNPYCYWCGCLVVKYKIKDNVKNNQPDNSATLDHLHHRLHKERGTHEKNNVPTTVLSCYRCNQTRNAQFFAGLTKAERILYSSPVPKIKDLIITPSNIILYKFK